ncbi:MAG: mechanosensitive ion channel [Mycobacterium sp.]|nr:mechanosensitive ion channel [Mycobacterium sp.]
MLNVLTSPWFYWAVGIALGLPLALILLTELQQSLRRRDSPLLQPVSLLRNLLVPTGALLMAMVGATQMPFGSMPVRLVSTVVAVLILMLLLAGVRASLFSNAPENSWRHRVPAIFLDVVRFGLIAIGVGLILAYIWGAHIGGMFTALGIGSIVIGLTLQNSVGQIISGLLMLFEQPFRIGDYIETDKAKGRVIEVNWRAVHIETALGMQIMPNSVLAGAAFTNRSRPAGTHATRVTSVFSVEDRPDQVCEMLVRIASRLPECDPDLVPVAVPIGTMNYRTKIPLRSPADDGDAEATFLRWIWYAARREGLHLDEADDFFSDPQSVADAIRNVVAPTLHMTAEQQKAMVPHASIERFGSGELVLERGVVPDSMSFVIAGEVKLTADIDDRTRAEVATITEGSFFGQSTLTRQPVTGSLFALTEVTVVRVHREAIEKVLHNNPVLLQEFGRAIDERRKRVEMVLADPGLAENVDETDLMSGTGFETGN